MYDLIGDIHGHATELKKLLTKLCYEETLQSWQHPERKIIFLSPGACVHHIDSAF